MRVSAAALLAILISACVVSVSTSPTYVVPESSSEIVPALPRVLLSLPRPHAEQRRLEEAVRAEAGAGVFEAYDVKHDPLVEIQGEGWSWVVRHREEDVAAEVRFSAVLRGGSVVLLADGHDIARVPADKVRDGRLRAAARDYVRQIYAVAGGSL
jgi:hypothetical protein